MWGKKRKPAPETTTVFSLIGTLPSMNEQLDKPKAEPRRINLRAYEYLSRHSAFYRIENPVESLKLRASFTQPETYGLSKCATVEFSRGLGPCGRWVSKLGYVVDRDLLRITQISFGIDLDAKADEFLKDIRKLNDEAKRIEKFGYGDVMAMTLSQQEYEHRLVALENLGKECELAFRDREFKEFIYKMSDVHGRIEVIK
ncbi:hypothetical protein ALEA_10 [Pseudomonas phage ALEA]|uniref:Uncharacterized protein n=1 Tax=Pseudomonas phage AH05 TaxID=2869574 RepID=A0AAE8BQU4_9CAUD|nr:hypothetical protein AH05_11 [Pseudomonas phage AH05]UAV89314.1 hypothetical protein ALEA_10 [Pseudomonas phage ALEA]UAV89413.1 hypothetical protein JOR_9 [Pseudomonas phage JOR]UAV89463.1 hypothetical protein M11_10 [Pseudomonas phage M1.1]UAV89512.1 hypothetical protein M12_9 [Pseudomonas phage M1.2]UAV89561.1 hypothetical protein M31_9 [Pseudomonas phage M3.1]UAV89784.1 hypothetical protein NOI_9 [Pseudomonas phage NOI]UAV90055.1 hypothetical protein SNK_9 [Pseudomonas phage SNK]